jgi:ATP-dependent protease ClpP protease subunit
MDRLPILIPPTPAALALARTEALNALADRRRDRRRAWYRIENNLEGESADLYIYDEIVSQEEVDFCGVGISAQGFVNELQTLRGQAINLYIKSPGGLVFDGIAIYNALLRHDAPVHVIVDGIAASIASVIAMAGTDITMSPGSMLMIHEPYGMTVGNAADHEQQAMVLNKMADSIAGIYGRRGDKRVNWRTKMAAESWFMAEEAVSLGLADGINESMPGATNDFDLSRYRNAPGHLASGSRNPAYLVMNVLTEERRAALVDDPPEATEPKPRTIRDAERALRDVGFSQSEAKAIVAKGWAGNAQREVEPPDSAETVEGPPVDEIDIQAIYLNYQKTLAHLNGAL